MAEPEIRYLGDLQRLDVKPGDKFVLSVPSAISAETASRLQDMFKRFVGEEASVIVLGDGIKVGVLSPEKD